MKKRNIIKRMVSDVEINNELVNNLQDRNIDQRFLYIWDWAKLYYKFSYNKERDNYISKDSFDDLRKFFSRNLEKYKGKRMAIIVLGCWNAETELPTLKYLQEREYEFTYFGVDYSEDMLRLAQKSLEDIDINKEFICADFISDIFIEEIINITKSYDQRIIAFIGETFNNVNQTAMADRLYWMMKREDLLWIDCPVRKNKTKKYDSKLLSYYSSSLNNKKFIEKDFAALKYMWVLASKVKLCLDSSKEESVGSMLFTFGFSVLKQMRISFAGKVTHLLVGDKIKVCNIRIYDLDTLANFFENYEFVLLDKMVTEENKLMDRGQLLFRK